MGLDMYLTGRKFFWHNYDDRATERREDEKRITTMDVELAYWRKHPDLHGFMVQEFADGEDDQKEIELDASAIRRVIAAIKANELPHTEGFFFGSSDKNKSQRNRDEHVFTEALQWLEAGDDDAVETEKVVEGGALTAIGVKLKPSIGKQRVSRSVHYRGDW